MSQLVVDSKSGIGNRSPQGVFYTYLFEQHYAEIMTGSFGELSSIVIEALHSIEGRDRKGDIMSPTCERVLVNLFIYNRMTSPEQRNAAIELFKNQPEEIFFRASDLFLYAQAADIDLDRGKSGMKRVWDSKLETSLYTGNASIVIKGAETILSGLGYGMPNLYKILDDFENLTEDTAGVVGTCGQSGERGILKRLNEKLGIRCDNLLRRIQSRAKREGKSVIRLLEAINGDGVSWR